MLIKNSTWKWMCSMDCKPNKYINQKLGDSGFIRLTNNNMNKREEFKKLVIMGNHPECKEYVEALLASQLETLYRCNRAWPAWQAGTMTEDDFEEMPQYNKITIGKVIQAFHQKELSKENIKKSRPQIAYEIFDIWGKLTENGQECTDDDQDDETIEALLKLLQLECEECGHYEDFECEMSTECPCDDCSKEDCKMD